MYLFNFIIAVYICYIDNINSIVVFGDGNKIDYGKSDGNI